MTWTERLSRISLAVIVLGAVWAGFLTLVRGPKFEAQPVLVMVWLSALILLLAVDSELLNKIKGVKFGDLLEVELHDSLEMSTREDYTSLADLAPEGFEGVLAHKGDLNVLQNWLDQARINPSKPVLLVTNLRKDDYVSKPMLFIYVYFLTQIAESVTLLFITAPASTGSNLQEIQSDSVIGAVSATALLKVFQSRCPWFLAFSRCVQEQDRTLLNEFLRWHRIPDGGFFWGRCLQMWQEAPAGQGLGADPALTKKEVRDWFGPWLSTRQIDLASGSVDLKGLRRALESKDEFVITVQERRFRSVVPTCDFSKQVAKRVIYSRFKT